MTKQQNEKTQKLMEELVDPSVWKLSAGVEVAGCVSLVVPLVLVAAAAAAESVYCSQSHF